MNGEDKRGLVTWQCSDEDTGPDVGLTIGLGGGKLLWVGEITDAAYVEAYVNREDVPPQMGGQGGWWIILYKPERVVIGKALDQETAHAMIDALQLAFSEQGEEHDTAKPTATGPGRS